MQLEQSSVGDFRDVAAFATSTAIVESNERFRFFKLALLDIEKNF